jgi:molecular chaperone DnaK
MIAGIDLGTTHSLIGVMDSGFPILIANEAGVRLTPSVVHFPEDGAAIVGREAVASLASAPERTVFSVKRLMGLRKDEVSDAFPFAIGAAPSGEAGVCIDDTVLLPEEIAAQILMKLKSDAERATGAVVDRAVITVPAYFNDAQRSATKRAGELAGISVERILSEPTAAALAYGLDRLGESSRVAVYDLGGGTFDISILELNQGMFEVKSTHGDTHLGGDDLDRATREWLATTLQRDVPREEARACKEALSTAEEILIDGKTITRSDLDAVWLPIIERTRSQCAQAVFDAGIDCADLDAVILVGGATRMPAVRQFVAGLFQRQPDCSQHPDEAVAIGAVIQAGIIDGGVRDITLLDVAPLSLGIETFGGLMNILIPRNTTIPVKRGEMFTNAVGNQASMQINVLQGEREMARDNWKLGTFDLAFNPAPKGQARVGVQFEIDANGILHVLARDIATGVEHVVQVASAVNVSDASVEQMVGDSVEHAFADMSERIFTETRIKAEEMLPAIDTALENMGSAIPESERTRITVLVDDVKAAIKNENTQRLKKLLTELDDATQDLATLLLESLMND